MLVLLLIGETTELARSLLSTTQGSQQPQQTGDNSTHILECMTG